MTTARKTSVGVQPSGCPRLITLKRGLQLVAFGLGVAFPCSLPAQSTNTSGALVVPAPSTNTNDTNVVEATLRDIKAPVEIPDYWLWLWIATGVLATALIAFLVWKYWLKKKF